MNIRKASTPTLLRRAAALATAYERPSGATLEEAAEYASLQTMLDKREPLVCHCWVCALNNQPIDKACAPAASV
jgi:hypothetical protein